MQQLPSQISKLLLTAEYGLYFVLYLTASSHVTGSDTGISPAALLNVYSQTTLNLIEPVLIPSTELTAGRPAVYPHRLH